jgi:hypothetical protein
VTEQVQEWVLFPRGREPPNPSLLWARAEWPVGVALAGTGVPLWGVASGDRVDRGVDRIQICPLVFTVIDLLGIVQHPRPAGIRPTVCIWSGR